MKYCHELALFGFFVFYPLNSALSGSAVVSLGKRGFSALLTLALLHVILFGKSTGRRPHTRASVPSALLFSYAAILLLATLLNHRPTSDYLEYATIPISIIALNVCERFRKGSFLQLLTLASCAHLALGLVINDRSVGTSGAERLGGWSHPINLGIEAAFILLFGASILLNGDQGRRLTGILLTAVGFYVLVQALSKTAIIGAAVGIALQLVFYKGRGRAVRAVIVVALLALIGFVSQNWISTELIGDSGVDSIETGTGRTKIWEHIRNHFSEYWEYGYGWAPLHKPGGRDTELLSQTNGLGAENAFVAALLMGGILALALFMILFTVSLTKALQMTESSHGYSLGMSAILVASALFVESAAGLNYHWFWLLGIFSLSNYLAPEPPPRRSLPDEPGNYAGAS